MIERRRVFAPFWAFRWRRANRRGRCWSRRSARRHCRLQHGRCQRRHHQSRYPWCWQWPLSLQGRVLETLCLQRFRHQQWGCVLQRMRHLLEWWADRYWGRSLDLYLNCLIRRRYWRQGVHHFDQRCSGWGGMIERRRVFAVFWVFRWMRANRRGRCWSRRSVRRHCGLQHRRR